MSWTDSDLATAFSAISPAPATLADAITALKAQKQTNVYVDVPALDVHDYLLLTGEYGGLLAAVQPSSTQPTNVQAEILALKSLIDNNRTVSSSNPQARAAIEGWLTTLSGLSTPLISSGTVTALEAMWGPKTIPKWSPQPIVADLQRLQYQGLIPSSIAAN